MVWRDSLHTNVSVARTPRRGGRSLLLVVMRGGSLRAVEEITGHKYEMIGRWFRPAAERVEALTEVSAGNPGLWTLELDEFWMFVVTTE